MRRACKLTLKHITQTKHRAIQNLLEAYRGAVNTYIRSLWQNPGGLDKITLARLPDNQTRLSNRYKAQALKQALSIIAAIKASAKALNVSPSRPEFKGSAILDAKFVTIEAGRGSFDLVVRLSTLNKGKRITLPTRRTAVLNKWLNYPNANLIQGCALSEKGLVLWVGLPDQPVKADGDVIGVDVGVIKLLATSDQQFLGTAFRSIRDKIKGRKKGSKGMRRARTERDHYINRTVKQLPWSEINAIGYEDLTNMKRGKGKSRSKSFRKAVAPWSYRQVRQRIECLAQEHRVRPVAVDPQGTSRTCPRCNTEDRRNRKGEKFRCIGCDYAADADYVGSRNILVRTCVVLGRVMSPRLQRFEICDMFPDGHCVNGFQEADQTMMKFDLVDAEEIRSG